MLDTYPYSFLDGVSTFSVRFKKKKKINGRVLCQLKFYARWLAEVVSSEVDQKVTLVSYDSHTDTFDWMKEEYEHYTGLTSLHRELSVSGQ